MLPRRATLIFLAILICCTAGDRTCRSGINTTIFGFPLQFWDESMTCSSSSQQSCFIGQLEFDVNFQNDNLTLTYGSCISTAYKDFLGCDKIFLSASAPNTQLLNALIPSVQDLMNNGIKTLSVDAATAVQNFLKNDNGELDNLRIVEELVMTVLKNVNQSIPNNAGSVLTKLDSLILTAILNVSQVGEASRDFLKSFGNLNTSDDAASKLLYELFKRNGLTVPMEFSYVIENLPGIIAQYIMNDPSYQIFNHTMFVVISNIEGSNITPAVSALSQVARLILPDIIDSDFNFLPIFDAFSNLTMQLIEGKHVIDLDIWRTDFLKRYSATSSISRSFSTTVVNFISNVVPGQQLSEGWVTLIDTFPGYLYMFTNNTVQLDEAFVTITNYLNLARGNGIVNIGQLNVSSIDIQDYIEFAMSLIDASGNLTAIGHVMTINDTDTFANSIFNLLSEFNIVVPIEYHPAIQNIPRLLSSILNQQQMNVSVVTELRNLLESGELSLNTTILIISNMIPADYNLRIFVRSLPNLIDELRRGNATNINQWQMDLIKAYGRTTAATQAFTNAVFESLKTVGVVEFVTEDIRTMIEYFPGYLYNFFPPDIAPQIDSVLYNISHALISTSRGSSFSLSNTLQSYSIQTSDPILLGVIRALDNILNLSRARNMTELAREAIMSFKRISFRTNQTTSLISSFRNLLHTLNITIPREYDDILDYTPGMIMTLIPGYEDYVDNMFGNISAYISAFDISNPDFDTIFQAVAVMVPPQYNLNRFLKSLSPLMSQLMIENYTYVNEWQIQLLVEYSNITAATEAITNSTLKLFETVGLYEYLPDSLITLIRYYPGYMYNFVPPNHIPQFELALHKIGDILKISESGNQVNVESILNSFALNTSEPALQITVTVLQRIVNLGSFRNVSQLGFQALISLKETSMTSNETAALSGSLLNFLASLNISIPVEYEQVLEQVPGVFLTIFPQYEGIVTSIFANASLILNDFDLDDYNSTFAALGMLIPNEYNLQMLIDSLPTVLQELTEGNVLYLNTWQLHLLAKYSRVTPATEAVANATFDFINRIGYHTSLTSDLRILIKHVPGHLYSFFPENMIGQLELALYSISDILYVNDGNRTIRPSEILQSYSLNTSDPSVIALTAIMDSIVNIANARNISDLSVEALKSLESVANITDESRMFSDSFIHFLQQFNISIPDQYVFMTRNVAGLLTVILPQQREVINSILFNASRILNATFTNGTNLEAVIQLLRSVSPTEYNLHLFMDTLPTLISQLTSGNLPYLYQWQSDVLNAYSISTPATESFLNSTVEFLTRAGLYYYLPDSQKALIPTYVGYIYYFIPERMTAEFESVLLNVSQILKITSPGQNVDIQRILTSFSVNVTDPKVQTGVSLINSIINLATVTNLTELGIQAFESLRSVSVLSNETNTLSASIIGILQQFGVIVPEEYKIVIENSLGLFNGLFQEQRGLINGILFNVSKGFETFNLSDPIFSSMTVLHTFIPEEYNLHLFIDSIPPLLEEIIKGNYAYVNEWQVNIVKSYGNETEASKQLSSSLMRLLDRYGVRSNVTAELETFIQYFPGLIYNFIPDYMISQLDLALANAANMLNLTDANTEINILDILDAYSVNITDAGLREALSSLNSILNIARSQTLMEFAEQSLASLKMFSAITNETSDLTDSMYEFLENINITLPSEYQDAVRHIPGLLISILPQQRDVIFALFVNVSRILQSFNSTKPDFQPIITLLRGFVPAEYNLDKLLLSVPSLLDALLSGHFEYVNAWQVNLLVEYSRITPATTAIANATIQLLERWNLYNSLDRELQMLIKYYPGYMYQILPKTLIPQYELALQGIADTIHLTDTNSNLTIRQLLDSFSFNMTSPGISEIVRLLDSISNIATARNVTEFGEQALSSLQSVADSTNVTQASSLALFQLLQRLNLTVSAEHYQIILSATNILVSAMPEHGDIITNVLMNISSIISQTNPTSPNFTIIFNDLIKLVPESYNLGLILDSIPQLLNQVIQGNFDYVNTWQLDILKSYSTVTEATETIYNSTVALIDRLGSNVSLPEEIFTFIKYYPGYFYNFVGNNFAILDTVLYALSNAMDLMFPSKMIDIWPLLESFNANFTNSLDSRLIRGLNSIVNAAMSGSLPDFRVGLVNSLKNIATITNSSQLLSASFVRFFDQMNFTYDEEYEVLITHVPAIFIMVFPEHMKAIDAVYQNVANNFNSFDALSPENLVTMNVSTIIEQIFNNTSDQLKAANISIPPEIFGAVSLMQAIVKDVVLQQGTIEEWVAKLSFLSEQITTNSSMTSLTVINQIMYGTTNLSDNEMASIVLEYLPRLLYLSYPGNKSFINVIFGTISNAVQNQGISENQLLINVTNELLYDVRPELRQLVVSFRNLIPALISNNQSVIEQWIYTATTQHCTSNRTGIEEFAKVAKKNLEMLGLTVPKYATNAFKCIPEMMYTLMANRSEILDDALRLGMLADRNYTAFVTELEKIMGVDFPADFYQMLDRIRSVHLAILTFNSTELSTVLSQFQDTLPDNTKVGNLTLEMLSRLGFDITEETKVIIKQAFGFDIFRMFPTVYPLIDIYLSSVTSSLNAGADLGTALLDAFASVNVTVSPRYAPLFRNMEPLIGGMVKNDMNIINKAVLDILVTYNTSFPSYEIQYVINQYRLQLILQNATSTALPKDTFIYLEDMYKLLMKMSNLSESFLKNAIIEAYPDSNAIVDIMFQLQPRDSIQFLYNATVWIFSNDRNVSVLATHIETVVDIFFQGRNFNVADVLISLTKPIASSCKYKTCERDICNAYGLLVPFETSTAPVTTPTTASATATATSSTARVTSASTTTTHSTTNFYTTTVSQDPTSAEVSTTSGTDSTSWSSTAVQLSTVESTQAVSVSSNATKSEFTSAQSPIFTTERTTDNSATTKVSTISSIVEITAPDLSTSQISSTETAASTVSSMVPQTTETTQSTTSGGQSLISPSNIHIHVFLLFMILKRLFL